jgi:hypothetical protein
MDIAPCTICRNPKFRQDTFLNIQTHRLSTTPNHPDMNRYVPLF